MSIVYRYIFISNLYLLPLDQLLAHGRWFSPGTPAYSTTKTGRHDIAEILLKVALKNQINLPLVSSLSDMFSINRPTLILKMICQCDIKHIMMLPIKIMGSSHYSDSHNSDSYFNILFKI